ncbi:MAG: indole-3-glycerol phosphate synthase TrpC [Deltaproteobacteria bacterium]|nr:indole-3-glycerol phosphate synthase TrpC [Deltaproteobacteria bacterium]
MNILEKILLNKKNEIEEKLGGMLPDQLSKNSKDLRVPLDLKSALKKTGLSVIAEVKKASPSKGLIREDFHPVKIAVSYDQNGASAISVLTEEAFFLGHPDYLSQIKKKVTIPVLRKDFLIDERQIRESYDMGADAVLLIVAALSEDRLKSMTRIAKEFGLSCLIEVHSEEELNVALKCKAEIIGVNNRNLITFKTDLQCSIDLAGKIPDNLVKVSESGINRFQDCELLSKHGFDAVLVGESLMRQPNPGKAIHSLLHSPDETN